MAASTLTAYDSPMLPIMKEGVPPSLEKRGGALYQAVGGFPIIRLLTETEPSDYYKALWNSCTSTCIWISSVGYQDTLDRLLQVFELTGFGDARVDARPLHTLITLNEVVSLYRDRKLNCSLGVKEVASRAISVDPDTMLTDAMSTMCEKRVRRLFLSGKKGAFVSDRNILAFLFSPKALKTARDAPKSWTDARLSEIQSNMAHFVSPDAMVEDVGRLLGAGRDVFMLSDEASLLSRWDLVMKPWKARRLGLSL